jgi:asparagine synthase (glutamine-hydrolysing)
MCGIFGLVGRNDSANAGAIQNILKHRGPDAKGAWQDEYVLLAHTRLSIIDLKKGSNQPFTKDRNYILVYNGEIYNYKALRNMLRNKYVFTTKSDTEVLYYALIEYGLDALNKLNGMFAFAFYDVKKRTILIARDRYGVKPIYYYSKGKKFIFSSEQKAIYGLIEPELNRDRLIEYFAYKYVAGPDTIIKDVYELEPGCCIKFDIPKNSFKKSRWYSFPHGSENDTKDLFNKVKDSLEDSVLLRTISDVPIGVQLSGGVDSSIITQIVSSHSPDMVKTYSIGFSGSEYDEGIYAKQISERIGTKHIQIDYTADDFLNDWELAAYHNDEPINHPHSLPILKLTKVASRDVKVLLSGEGADEVFYGYEQYWNKWNRDFYKNDKDFLDSMLFNSGAILKRMLIPELIISGNLYGYREKALSESRRKGYNEKFYEFSTHLNTLLNRIDKMSMANSVEIRTPYLDYRLAEIGFNEKKKNLIDGKQRKKPIMDVYESLFKDGMSNRKKVGFRVPYDEWLQTNKFKKRICEYIDILSNDPVFNKGYIIGMLDSVKRHSSLAGKAKESWVLANYSIWKQRFNIR